MPILPGENVGPYRIIEQLGSGGMATVFKAYHASLDRYVAIKVLHPAFKQDPQFFERFKREARIVANLEHPNIIPVYDFNEHHGEPYLVMRFVEGDTLKAKMSHEPMPRAQILRLMRPVCQALAYAHQQGVLHRDIKPSNIMLTSSDSVFLTDFGLARMVQAGESTLSQDMMVGTPQYISPEQAQGLKELDGRTDIYSLGVVLYEMLTGRVPFNADTPFATVHDHIYAPLPLPSDINPKIEPAVERLLLKALAKNPADRFATVTDLLNALENTLAAPAAPIPAAASAPIPAKKGIPWWVWAGSAALILLVVAGLVLGGLLLRARRNAPPVSRPPAEQAELPPANSDAPPQPAPPAEQAKLPPDETAPEQPGTSSAEALARQANQAMRNQNMAEAVGLYEQAIAADPHYLPAYFGLSLAQRAQGQHEASMAALQQAVDNNPTQAAAWARLGEGQLFFERNPTAALDSLTKAAELEPDNATLVAGQAIALTQLNRPTEAKAAIDRALALEPDSPEVHLANAYYLKQQGNRLAALREVRQIIQNNAASPLLKERARELLGQLGG